MRAISSEQWQRRMRIDNPWWSEGRIQPAYSTLKPRAFLGPLCDLVGQTEVRRAVVLMGSRRVGKTVLLHQIISQLLDAHRYEPREVAYISLGQPLYARLSIEDIAQEIREASGNPQAPRVLVLDDIQYLADWEQHLKAFVDTHPHVKCVASGSATPALRLRGMESGAGRFTDFVLPPLTFCEFLSLRDIDGLVDHEADNEYRLIDIEELNRQFIDYLDFGGYPELISPPASGSEFRHHVCVEIVDCVLLRDMPSLYGIQDTQELNAVFASLACNTAREVSLEDLARGSGVTKPTLRRYLEYLEAALLIKVVHRIDREAHRFRRAARFKVYATAPALLSALFGPLSADEEAVSAAAETAVFAQWLHTNRALNYARWRGGEVDLVLVDRLQRPEWCVEVNWSDPHVNRLAGRRGLSAFAKQHPAVRATVTTRTVMESGVVGPNGSRVDLVPVSLYCYIAGHRAIHGLSATATFRISA